MPERNPRWALALSWLLPARYRAEVLDDLLEERLAMIAQGRSRVVTGSWLFVHIVRSAVAGHTPRFVRHGWRGVDGDATRSACGHTPRLVRRVWRGGGAPRDREKMTMSV